MYITHIQLKNFRCFKELNLSFDKPVILLEGVNGTGKTSILEALHYACYLRSFRTYSPNELTHFEQDSFFLKIQVSDSQTVGNEIKIGFSGKKRVVKVNQKNIVSYKELMDFYRVVTLTEDDLALIKEGPEIRRSFLDQVIMLYDPDFSLLLKKLRYTVDSRNALFKQRNCQEYYDFWSRELWDISLKIRQSRREALFSLESGVKELLLAHFPKDISISCIYNAKRESLKTFEEFLEQNPLLYHNELQQGRSLFGAHLDDFTIQFKSQRSRAFASRGQQKLIILLLKIAQIQDLIAKSAVYPILLLDDFMTDFDQVRSDQLIDVLKMLNCQLIFTSPVNAGSFVQKLSSLNFQRLIISY